MVSQLCHVGLSSMKPFQPPLHGFPSHFWGNYCFGGIQCNLEWKGDPQLPTSIASAHAKTCYHTALSHLPLGSGLSHTATLPLWVKSYAV